MKYAISCNNDSPDSNLSEVFARCEYFAIWDSVSDRVTFLSNPFQKRDEHVGEEVVSFLANEGVQRIIAASFGTKVQNKLTDLHLQMIVFDQGGNKLDDVLKLLRHSVQP